MGFLDSFLGKTEEAPSSDAAKGTPFKMTLRFSPLRLTSMKDNMVKLVVNVQNVSGDAQLVSVDALLPRREMVGFDPTCINKHVEKKVGELASGESKEVVIPIWGSNQTKAGSYPVEVKVFAHYLNYDKVINYVRKTTSLRAV